MKKIEMLHNLESIRKMRVDYDMKTHEIAAVFDVHEVTMAKFLKKHGIPKVKVHANHNPPVEYYDLVETHKNKMYSIKWKRNFIESLDFSALQLTQQ